MKKRIATLFLAIIMLLTLAVPALAESFSDVGSSMGTKYRDAINYMSDNGIMMGFEDGTFQPNTVLNRGMAVTILFRMSHDTSKLYFHSFTDVPSSSPYYNAIGWAKAKGICYGTTDTTFEPYANVSKQQFITFLYRFAGCYGYPQSVGTASITNFADYSSLSEYAKIPFRWAYNYGLFDGGDFSSSYLYPFDTVSRKNAALLCLNYRHNVEGIVHGRDDFSFDNCYDDFVSGLLYLMSSNDWSAFSDLASRKGLAKHTVNYLKNDLPWQGACFGMSVAIALDYCGKVDFNGNFCNNASSMYQIPSPNDINNSRHILTTAQQNNSKISVAESKINLLHLSQFITDINSWAKNISASIALGDLLEGQENGGVGVFMYTVGDEGHVVNVYGKPVLMDHNKYRVSIYDNRAVAGGYILINGSSASGYSGKVIFASADGTQYEEAFKYCRYQSDFSLYDSLLDLDGADNTIQSVANVNTLKDYAILSVDARDSFTITNAENKTLTLSSTGISGTMNTYKENIIVLGENYPPIYLFAVPKSDSFVCAAIDGKLNSFYVTSATGTVGASTNNENYDELSIVTVTNLSNVTAN